MNCKEIPSIGAIYRDYRGAIFQIKNHAIRMGTNESMVVCQSLDDEITWCCSLSEFNQILGDDNEGTCYHRFQKITELGYVWQSLESSLKEKTIVAISSCSVHPPIWGEDPLEAGAIAFEKMTRILLEFEAARNCQIDINPNKYVKKEITRPQEWGAWESYVFTGVVYLRAFLCAHPNDLTSL